MKNRFRITIFLAVSSIFLFDGESPSFAFEPEFEHETFKTLIRRYLSINGKIELESEWSEDYNNEHANNVSLTALEVNIQIHLAEWGEGKLILDWDDEKKKMIVDETFLTVGNTEKFPFFLQAGRYDLPFGAFEGNTISDPLTKEAFETKEDAVMLGLDLKGFHGHFYTFDGETNRDHKKQFGGGFGYRMDNDFIHVDGGIDFINSVLDSNIFGDNLESGNIKGLAVHTQLGIDGFGIFAEYISALDSIEGSKPRAWHFECSYVMDVMKKETFFSLGYSQTANLAGHLPKRRIAATTGIEFFEGFMLTLEYAHDTDYRATDDSFGDTNTSGGEASIFTVQFAYEF